MEFVTIEKQTAYNAYYAISFSPEKRAETTVNGFNEGLRSDYEALAKLAVSAPQKKVLETEFERYQQGYKSKFESYLHAKGRTMSPMITGPARFPVDSNNKKIATERKRWDEFSEWQKKAYRSIVRKIDAAKTGEQIEADREQAKNGIMAYLLKESISVIACLAGESPFSPQLLKQALERKVINAAKNYPDLALQAVNEINRMCQEKCKKDVFTAKHGIFSKLGAIKEHISKPQEVKEDKELYKNGFLTVVLNFQEQRIQFLFEDKPNYEARSLMKSNGFKWSPRFMAWQRQHTNNAMYASKKVIDELNRLEKVF